jgi:protein TonB
MRNNRHASAYLDALFLNRNKDYGAYELRVHYPSRVRKAMAAVLFSAVLLALIPFLTAGISQKADAVLTHARLDTVVVDRLPPVEKKPPVEPEKPEPKPVASQKVTPPKVVEDHKADDKNVLQAVDTAKAIATVETIGEPTLRGENKPVAAGSGKGGPIVPSKPPRNEPVAVVTEQPVFPGDVRAYLADKLRYPEQAREAGIDGRVIVRFVVDEEGAISGATVMRGIGGGCDEEALRVVRSMPRWKPAKLNGEVVKSYFSLPIKFTLED